MNINELEELAKEWNRFDADNEYSQSFLELIAAYREAVSALNEALPGCIGYAEYWSGKGADKADKSCMQVREALDTAKRLGVE